MVPVLWLLLPVSSLLVIVSNSLLLTESESLNNYLCGQDYSSTRHSVTPLH